MAAGFTNSTPEKENIAGGYLFLDIDVLIYDYLKWLEDTGVGLRDYETIWYYY